MKKFQLHFPPELLKQKEILMILRPTKAKLFRILSVPDVHKNNTELIQVLNTLCYIKVKDIWFFKIDGNSTMLEISDILWHMDVEHVVAEPQISQTVLTSDDDMRIHNN